jgi:glutamate carboxypeptidase
MERTPKIVELYERAKRIAGELGFALNEVSVGGGSDGNFAAAVGAPVLDGLGAVGDGGHAEHEHIIVDSLPERTALAIEVATSLR